MDKKLPNHLFGSSDIEITTAEKVYQDHLCVKKYHLKHRLFKGGVSQEFSREILDRNPSVGVLAYDPQRDWVILIEQFRAGALRAPKSPWLYEIIAGYMEPGETPEAVAERESLEETGLTIQALHPISQYWASPGCSSEYIYLFCGRIDATHAGGVHGLASENEDIKNHVISRHEALTALQNGRINNAPSIIAIQWLAMNYPILQQQWI